MSFVEARNVTKRFGDNTVLSGVDLDVGEHEVVCLIGASGSGKSTLLRCLNLLEEVDEGTIAVDGQSLTNGKIEGNHLTAQCTSPDGVVYKIDVTVDGDKARGEVTATQEGQAMKGKIELSRVKS